MADIAERLGISVVSVSKGLSGREGVSDELRARILATARQMGYRGAREAAPAQGESNRIGILVLDRFFNENAFYNNLYRDMLTACQRRKLVALMEIVTNEAERDCAVPALVEANRVDGLIFMGEFTTACGFLLGLLLAAAFAWSAALLARFSYTVPGLWADSLRMIAAAPLPTCGLLLSALWPAALLRFLPEVALYILPLTAFFGGGLSALAAAWCARDPIRVIELRVGYDRDEVPE